MTYFASFRPGTASQSCTMALEMRQSTVAMRSGVDVLESYFANTNVTIYKEECAVFDRLVNNEVLQL